MGRSKHYKSISQIKRSMKRLIVYLFRKMKRATIMLTDDSRKMLEPNSDTSVHLENSQESSPIYTSTPKRIQKACNNCLKQCFEKHQFGIHIEAEHDSWPWQLDKPHSGLQQVVI
jgi:hypothetical protein